MNGHKALLVGLSLALLAAATPPGAWADGDRGTRAEEDAYALRESSVPCVASFVGGNHRWAEALILFYYTFYAVYFVFYGIGWAIYHGVESVCGGCRCRHAPAYTPLEP